MPLIISQNCIQSSCTTCILSYYTVQSLSSRNKKILKSALGRFLPIRRNAVAAYHGAACSSISRTRSVHITLRSNISRTVRCISRDDIGFTPQMPVGICRDPKSDVVPYKYRRLFVRTVRGRGQAPSLRFDVSHGGSITVGAYHDAPS